jgi:Na+/glutamate symporter
MFQEFMQMGVPAAFAIVGLAGATAAVIISGVVRGQIERAGVRKYELDRMAAANQSKMIEHKKKGDQDG